MMVQHGSYAGYQAHRRAGIPSCDACDQARRDYINHWRAVTRDSDTARNTRRRDHTNTALLRAFRDLAPDLYARLRAEAIEQWERANPKE